MGSTPMGSIQVDLFNKIQNKVMHRHHKKVTQQISLSVAFFNYGVCTSPFQYYTEDEQGNLSPEIINIQKILRHQYKKQTGNIYPEDPKKHNWNIGNLDTLLKKHRYSPLYYENIGIIHNKFLMDKQAFKIEWDLAFEKAIIHHNVDDIQDFTLKRDNLYLMDWIFYRTFVVYAYSDERTPQQITLYENGQLDYFQIVLQKHVCRKYQKFMSQKFQLKIINEKYKIQKMIRNLKKFEVDIFFLQDIDEKTIRYIEKKTTEFRIVQCRRAKSAILISWKGLRNIVGDSIRPFEHYNKKYFDPNLKYEISEVTSNVLFEEKYVQTKFQDNTRKIFQFAPQPTLKKLKSKKSPNNQIKQNINTSVMFNPQGHTFEQKNIDDEQSDSQTQTQAVRHQTKVHPQIKVTPQNQMTPQNAETIKKSQNLFISPKLFDDLIWNDSTIVQFFNNIILITSYFSSDENNQQQQWMVESLQDLRRRFPNHTILVAVNSQKQSISIPKYHAFPDVLNSQQKISTVYKRKTMIQPKAKRAGDLYDYTTDFFISTVPLTDAKVIDVNHNEMTNAKKLIPNESHPYDHYLLHATLKCTVTKKVFVDTPHQESEHA